MVVFHFYQKIQNDNTNYSKYPDSYWFHLSTSKQETYPPGNDHICHQTGSLEKHHRLKSAFLRRYVSSQEKKIVHRNQNTPRGPATWRIIPVSKWVITTVSKSPPSKWPKWLINGGVLSTYQLGWSSKQVPPAKQSPQTPRSYGLRGNLHHNIGEARSQQKQILNIRWVNPSTDRIPHERWNMATWTRGNGLVNIPIPWILWVYTKQ